MLRSLLILVVVLSLVCIATGASAQALLWYMGDVHPNTENSCGPGLKWTQWHGAGTVVDEGTLAEDPDAWDGKAWHIVDTNYQKDAWRTQPSDNFGGLSGGTVVARIKVISESSGGGNFGMLEHGGLTAQCHWGGPTGHVKEAERDANVWVTSGNDDKYHIFRMTVIRSSTTNFVEVKVYMDEQPAPVLEVLNGANSGNTGMDAYLFGSTGTGGTQDIYFDWITGTNLGAFAPGEEEAVLGRSIIPVQEVARTIDECKKVAGGAKVELPGALVTATTFDYNEYGDIIPGGFVIESTNRNAGIRVKWNDFPVYSGEIVDILGTVTMLDGERIIQATSVESKSTDNEIPDILYLTNKASGGGTYGKQMAVVDDASQTPAKMSAETNNVGILMKLTGKVTAAKTDSARDMDNYVYIDDGSGLNDGSGNIGIKCSPATDPSQWATMPSLGSNASVTGVMGVRQINGVNTRYFMCVKWETIPN